MESSMLKQFPDNVPSAGTLIQLGFPDGLVTETFVRQRSFNAAGEIMIHLGGKEFGPFGRTLTLLEDGTWTATRLDNMMIHAVDLEIIG
jgi:hypothetical protein